MNHSVIMAFAATLGTWFVTALGAATVAFFRSPSQKSLNTMLGFASGVIDKIRTPGHHVLKGLNLIRRLMRKI